MLSHFSHVRLCVTPQTLAQQTPPSLGFSRQEYWTRGWANPRDAGSISEAGPGLTPQTALVSLRRPCSKSPGPGSTLPHWGLEDPPQVPRATPGPAALTEKVVLVTSTLLWVMPPLRLPGMPPPCCFFWLLTMVSMEWLRTRMALCRDSR